jgi:hypothetical protein
VNFSTSTTPLTTLAGTATDDVSFTVTVSCSPSCGTPAVTNATGSPWSVASLNLTLGETVITATAIDGNSQRGQDQITVTYTPPSVGMHSAPHMGLSFGH